MAKINYFLPLFSFSESTLVELCTGSVETGRVLPSVITSSVECDKFPEIKKKFRYLSKNQQLINKIA
jgi:hypothetical protein